MFVAANVEVFGGLIVGLVVAVLVIYFVFIRRRRARS
jgi:preprotein translocase subunit YajC